jgi:hypothetical protein
MSLYSSVLEGIKKNKQIKQGGGFVGIPYPFPRLAEYIPVIEKGQSIGILAPTGSGKSRFARYVFLYHVYKFYKQTGYKVRVIYLPLEDSAKKVYLNIICNYLKDVHNIYITLQELNSKGDRQLPDFVEDKLEEAVEYFADFEKVITIVDGLNDPDEILKLSKQIAGNLGVFKKYKKAVEGGEVEQIEYESDTHVIMIVDNMSNIDGQNEQEQEAILRFGKDIVRKVLCNIFGWTVVQVLQLDFASERQQYNKDGNTIVSKLEPSLAGIGDSKRVSRSMHTVFGMFNPSRYEILKFPTPSRDKPQNYYDIQILGNRFRSLNVIKSNDSDVGMKIGLMFDGIAETFTELPDYTSQQMMDIYNKVVGKPNFIKAKREIVFREDDFQDAPF